jgi:hypothetical protein
MALILLGRSKRRTADGPPRIEACLAKYVGLSDKDTRLSPIKSRSIFSPFGLSVEQSNTGWAKLSVIVSSYTMAPDCFGLFTKAILQIYLYVRQQDAP